MYRPPNWARLSLLALTLWATPALAAPRLLHAPAAADPMQVHIYRLDNGLTVYLSRNDQEPRFHAEVIVRAGSKNDPDDLSGMAHYMEHMLFKGTSRLGTADYASEKVHLDRIRALYDQRFATTDSLRRAQLYARINDEAQLAARYAIPSEMDRLYTSMGERGLNAATSQEYILYRVDLPANRLRQWARIEAERFRDPVFRLFQTELETVYEEMNMRVVDNKEALVRNAVNAMLYQHHPYGRPIIGWVEDLRNPCLSRMYDFFRTYYVPANMAVLISGDIDIQEAIQIIDEEYSVWQPGKVPRPRHWREPRIQGVRRDTVYYPGEEFVLLAFRTQPSTHKDTEALQVLDMILDNAVAGLINLNLNQQQRVRQAGSYTTSHGVSNDYGAQYLWGIPKEGQSLDEVERLLLEQVELIKHGDFEAWLIPAIVTDFKKTHEQQLENNAPRVALMREAFVSGQKWQRARRKLERMAQVDKRDVVRMAKKYFAGGYVAGYRLDGPAKIPPIDKPHLDTIDIDATRRSAFAQEILDIPFAPIAPQYVVVGQDYEVRQVRDGVELYWARNPLNELYTLTISVDLGTRTENRLAIAAELLDKAGTAGYTAEELKKQWYKLGTDFGFHTGDQQSTITLSGLGENFSAAVALMAQLFQAPSADEETLTALKQIILKKRQDAKKDHRTIHQALCAYHRYGEQAYYRRILANDAVLALTVDELLALIRTLPHYQQTWTYSGPLSAAEVEAVMGTAFPLPEQLQAPPPYQVLRVRAPQETEIYLLDREMAQAQVRIDFGDGPYDPQLSAAIQLFNEYFYGGMAGIVFQELREARALAYSAWAWYFDAERREDYDMMSGFIGTQADKTVDALDAFLELMDHLPQTPERFANARTALLSKYRTQRLGFRQIPGAARTWKRQGLSGDPRPQRFAAIDAADLDTVLRFHREHVGGRPRLISIVGDRRHMDLEELSQYGKIVEVGLDDIFAF